MLPISERLDIFIQKLLHRLNRGEYFAGVDRLKFRDARGLRPGGGKAGDTGADAGFGIGDGIADVSKLIGGEVVFFQQVLELDGFIIFLRRTVLDELEIRSELEVVQ